ncbi:hypothetical protein GCM10028807_04010 [Spirosoma daeguense]
MLQSSISRSLLFLTLLGTLACKTPDKQPYRIGFQTYQTVDSSRIYKTGSKPTDYLHYRPLDIDVWYPAQASSGDSAMRFGDFLRLLEKRANYYTATTDATGYAAQLADYLCKGLKCSDTTRLLAYKTNSYRNSEPVGEKFPLIIYLSSYNGMGYENCNLLEAWAKQGFVVASINSIGRYPGNMTMKNADLMEQVKDALASLQFLKAKPYIDFSRIGVAGYSWGGLAGILVADKLPETVCLLSLDGSEFHHYGSSAEEDADFNQTANSPDFKRMAFSKPYLRLEQSPVDEKSGKDSVYNFLTKLSGEKQILKIDSASHEDFSSMPTIVRASGNCVSNARFDKIVSLSTQHFKKHLIP